RSSGKSILQWRDENLRLDRVTDPGRLALLTGATVYAEGLEEFKARIVRTAKDLLKPPPPPPGDDFRVLIVADRSDRDLAQRVAAMLAQEGVSPTLPPWDRPFQEYRTQLFHEIETCCALLVVCRDAPRSWIQAQFADIVRVEVRRPTRLAKMVVDARPT